MKYFNHAMKEKKKNAKYPEYSNIMTALQQIK